MLATINLRRWWLGVFCLLAQAGCIAKPYQYGRLQNDGLPQLPTEVAIEQGTPSRTLQRMAYVVDTPARVLPFGKKVRRHELAPETVAQLEEYLHKNQLTDVYVYINHYDPAEDWELLRQNTAVAPLWRYSLGSLHWIGYTVLPNPVFGGNTYNPYTNALYLNVDQPARVLHAAAAAKDIRFRRFPGTYAAVTSLPGIAVWRDAKHVGDVVGYARAEEDWQTEQQAYRVLYPRIGMDGSLLASPLVAEWWARPVLSVSGAAVGHLAGRAAESRREAELAATKPPQLRAPAALSGPPTEDSSSPPLAQHAAPDHAAPILEANAPMRLPFH